MKVHLRRPRMQRAGVQTPKRVHTVRGFQDRPVHDRNAATLVCVPVRRAHVDAPGRNAEFGLAAAADVVGAATRYSTAAPDLVTTSPQRAISLLTYRASSSGGGL